MRRVMFVLSVLLLGVVAGPAAADIPPINACQEEGRACFTAGNDHQQKGVCAKQRCSKTLPGPDGKPQTNEYDCLLCVEAAAAPAATVKKKGCSVGGEGGGE